MNLYAIRDKSTGKITTGITNPSHKFWETRKRCKTALNNYKQSLIHRSPFCRQVIPGGTLDYVNENYEIVEFELQEVK